MSTIKITSMQLLAAVFAIAALGIPQRASAQTPMTNPTIAWSTDTGSSVGLCENAWDFNAPSGVPGFGPIQPGDVEASLALIQIGASPAFAGKQRLSTQASKREALHIAR